LFASAYNCNRLYLDSSIIRKLVREENDANRMASANGWVGRCDDVENDSICAKVRAEDGTGSIAVIDGTSAKSSFQHAQRNAYSEWVRSYESYRIGENHGSPRPCAVLVRVDKRSVAKKPVPHSITTSTAKCPFAQWALATLRAGVYDDQREFLIAAACDPVFPWNTTAMQIVSYMNSKLVYDMYVQSFRVCVAEFKRTASERGFRQFVKGSIFDGRDDDDDDAPVPPSRRTGCRPRSNEWKNELFRSQQCKCANPLGNCPLASPTIDDIELDHIHRWADSHDDSDRNIWGICAVCHRRKTRKETERAGATWKEYVDENLGGFSRAKAKALARL